jgi:CRP-like cAMP-binding protein
VTVDESLVARLLDVGTPVEFPVGRVLIERGQPGSGLFLIQHGTVTVEADEGQVELGPGDVVGEFALADPDGRRTARVVAKTEVRAVAVDRAAYDAAVSG